MASPVVPPPSPPTDSPASHYVDYGYTVAQAQALQNMMHQSKSMFSRPTLANTSFTYDRMIANATAVMRGGAWVPFPIRVHVTALSVDVKDDTPVARRSADASVWTIGVSPFTLDMQPGENGCPLSVSPLSVPTLCLPTDPSIPLFLHVSPRPPPLPPLQPLCSPSSSFHPHLFISLPPLTPPLHLFVSHTHHHFNPLAHLPSPFYPNLTPIPHSHPITHPHTPQEKTPRSPPPCASTAPPAPLRL
jgi:hypothetical protein